MILPNSFVNWQKKWQDDKKTVKPHVIEPLRSICHAPKELIIDQDRISFYLPPVFLKNLKIFGALGAAAVTNLKTYCCDRTNFEVSNFWLKNYLYILLKLIYPEKVTKFCEIVIMRSLTMGEIKLRHCEKAIKFEKISLIFWRLLSS